MNDDPLVPVEVDLRGLPFMPLDVIRLMDSDLFALSTGDEFKAAVALWCKSWQQNPAGSLPDDDRVLAHLSGTGAKWRKVKKMAMRGWRLCHDGRWYHELIAEKALEAWEHRLKHRERMERNADKLRQWREKKQLQEPPSNADVTVTEPVSQPVTKEVTKPVTKPLRNLLDSDSDSEVTAKGQGQRSDSDSEVTENLEKKKEVVNNQKPKSVAMGVEKPTPPLPKKINGHGHKPKTDAKTGPVWDAYSGAYFVRYGTEPVRNAKANGVLAALIDRLGIDEAAPVAAFYVRHNKAFYVGANHPLGVLLQDCEGLRTQWATGQQITATQAMQTDRTQTNLSSFAPLIAAAKAKEKAEAEAKEKEHA